MKKKMVTICDLYNDRFQNGKLPEGSVIKVINTSDEHVLMDIPREEPLWVPIRYLRPV